MFEHAVVFGEEGERDEGLSFLMFVAARGRFPFNWRQEKPSERKTLSS
jgi:hypothetical protein